MRFGGSITTHVVMVQARSKRNSTKTYKVDDSVKKDEGRGNDMSGEARVVEPEIPE